MQLWQVQSKAQPITPPGSEKERITPDKWQPNTNTPQANWHAAKIAALAAVVLTAPFIAFTNLGQPERSTPDKWQPATNQPIFDIKRQQQTYPVTAPQDPTSMRPNQIWVDKLQSTNQYLVFPDIKRWQYLYPAQASNPQPITSAETISLDKWVSETARPAWLKPNQNWITLSVLELTSAQRPEAVSLDRWQQPQSQPRFDITRQQWIYPSFIVDSRQLTQSERITVDKWQPETNKPLFDLKRQQHTYPFSFFYPEPKEATEFESPSEFARNVDKVYDIPRNQYLYPPFATDPNALTAKERVSFDKWNFQQSIPRFDVARNQFLYPPFSASPQALTQAERSTPDKWLPLPNQPLFSVKRQEWTYPALSFNPRPLPIAEFLNLWAKQPEQIFIPAKPLAHLYPHFATDAKLLTQKETVSFDRWHYQQSLPRWDVTRNQYLYPTEHFNPFAIGTPATFIEAALQPQSQPLFDVKRTQATFPAFIRSPQPVAAPETITTDKWQPAIVQPLFAVKRALWLYQVWVVDPKHLTDHETILLSEWFRETGRPVFDVKRWQYLYPALSIDANFFVKPPFYRDKYHPQGDTYSDKLSARGTTFNDKYSSRSSTYGDKYSGRSSTYNDKYSGRGTAYSDKYSPRNL